MTWRRYLQSRTRNPAWLWRMVIGILLAGLVAGFAVDAVVHREFRWMITGWLDVPSDAEPPAPDRGDHPASWDRLDSLAAQGEWRAVWQAIPRVMLRDWRHVGVTALALLTGVCWLAFSAQAIQPRSRRDGRLWLVPVAFVLGVLSIWPTIFLIVWQEHRLGIAESEELRAGLKFYVFGVGLREELSKFVCFLPLLPWCVRRRDELAALVLAGCVGIGFAAEENVNYIGGQGDAIGRMLSAAPLHMAMTGLIGLAAFRACVWPREWAGPALAMFGGIVAAHGLYDAFIVLPALADYNLVAPLVFVGLAYQYFRELRPKQQLRVEPVSLTANFLFCVCTVAAATFIYLCAVVGWRGAANVLFAGILGQAVMVYMFLREMPETMVSV
jgi:RsiW-degrading membrane proteinase PrsW (M82 family)